MSVAQALWRLICSPWLPPQLGRALLATLSRRQAARRLQDDRRLLGHAADGASPAGTVYLLDGFHGGIPFWDWVTLPKGGLWEALMWPAVGEVLVQRALELKLPAVRHSRARACHSGHGACRRCGCTAWHHGSRLC